MHNLMTIIGVLLLIGLAVFFMRGRDSSSMPGTSSKNPLEEAELFLAWGRKKEAKAILEKYLLSNPGNQKALELLKQAN